MSEFITERWIILFFGLLSTAIIAYVRYLNSKFQQYKQIIEERNTEELEDMIAEQLEPVQAELVETKRKFEAIKDSYRYRLIFLCEQYLDRGYLTPKEYSSLSEMWKVYHGLGGNSQAEDYYHKVEHLPVHEHDHIV